MSTRTLLDRKRSSALCRMHLGGTGLFQGFTGALTLNKSIAGVVADPLTDGYSLVASDGGMFWFNALFKGSVGSTRPSSSIVGMSAP